MRNLKIITRIDVVETLASIEIGEKLKFECSEFASLSTVRNACLRLNKERRRLSLSVHSLDNGVRGYVERRC